jgi:hypothetical protein
MTWRTLFRPGVFFRICVLASSLLALAPVSADASGNAPPKVVQVSSDPFTNSSSQHQTEVEPQTLGFGNTFVAVFQAGRFFTGGGSSAIGFATSLNAGATWTSGFLPGLTIYSSPAGPFVRATDAAVAFDAKHGAWLVSSLACMPPNCAAGPDSIVVSRSTNGGTVWSAPVTVFAGGVLDHPWIACDNATSSGHFGRCYVSLIGFGNQTVRSDDGGVTWSAPVASTGLGALQNIVQPDGDLVIVGVGAGGQGAVRSTDGGLTFGPAVPISNILYHGAVGMRAVPAPGIQVDGGGKLFVSWSDCRFRAGCSTNDIVYSTSSDALAWSSVARVPIDKVTSTVNHILPGLGVDRTTSGSAAHIALVYYFLPKAACTFPTPDTCRLEVGFISSSDGGKTWSNPHKLSHQAMDIAWLASTDLGHMVGDYFSCGFAGGHTATVFALASKPVGSQLQEGMFAAVS